MGKVSMGKAQMGKADMGKAHINKAYVGKAMGMAQTVLVCVQELNTRYRVHFSTSCDLFTHIPQKKQVTLF